jgi:hypothetical protein
MADLIKLTLDEAIGSTTFANTGTAGGTWTASASPPTAGATGIINNCIAVTDSGIMNISGGGGSTTYEPTSNSFTVYCWFKPNTARALSITEKLVHKSYRPDGTWTAPYSSIELFTYAEVSGYPYFYQGVGCSVTITGTRYEITGTSIGLHTSNWSMIAMTFGSNTLNLYLNGTFLATLATSGSCDFGTHGKWYISGSNEVNESVNGSIDEVTVQSGVLTRDQLAAIYNAHGNTDVVTSNAWTNAELSGNRRLDPVINYGYTIPALTFSAAKLTNQVRVDFSRALRSLAATTVAGNYVITGPSTIAVNSVTFTPGQTYLILNTTGSYIPGSYTLTVAANTAEASADDTFNSGNATFDGGTIIGGGSNFNAGFW